MILLGRRRTVLLWRCWLMILSDRRRTVLLRRHRLPLLRPSRVVLRKRAGMIVRLWRPLCYSVACCISKYNRTSEHRRRTGQISLLLRRKRLIYAVVQPAEIFSDRNTVQGGCFFDLFLAHSLSQAGSTFAAEKAEYSGQQTVRRIRTVFADDFVLATGETHTVREFVEAAFREVGIEIEWCGTGVDEKGFDAKTGNVLVDVDPKYFRPAEVDLLLGNPAKAERELGWRRKVTFVELVKIMVAADLENFG